jgi:DNA invertase Pin-like site-specific DNA recombinase
MVQEDKVVRPQRVLIYSRFSKKEHGSRSCGDQQESCRDWLTIERIECSEVLHEEDDGISGEHLSRPGIDRVRKLVRDRRVDLLVGEDVSRFFRDRGEPHKLAGECKDHGVRFVAINDGIDTDEVDWQSKLSQHAEEHAAYNDKLAYRIMRAALARWKRGEAMGPLKPGYKRVVIDSVRHELTHHGPYKDEKDERWSATIEEFFHRAARGDPPATLADFLNAHNFPPVANSLNKLWTATGAKNLIKNPIYKGIDQFRATISQKHYSSGHRLQAHNSPEAIWLRPMPHLRFVSDLVWRQANDAIAKRDVCGKHSRGLDNPNYRVPRESRSLLSNHFYCGACGGKMIGVGRAGGGYRCGAALRGLCWCRASVKRDFAHQIILQAVIKRLTELPDAVDTFVSWVQGLHPDRGDIDQLLANLQVKISAAQQRIGACGEALLDNPTSPYLSGKLKNAEAEEARLIQERAALESQVVATPPLSRARIVDEGAAAMKTLSDGSREAGLLLRQIITPIQAVPFQRIDSSLVVLRARFQIDLTALLPCQWQEILRGAHVDLKDGRILTQEAMIDLFDSPGHVRFAEKAYALHQQGVGAEDVGRQLGIPPWTAHNAIRLGQMMQEQGLSEPYVELKAPPGKASRWGRRKQVSGGQEAEEHAA